MKPTLRRYDHASDYERVGRFLDSVYEPAGMSGNWLQPRWEYMHHHPSLEPQWFNKIGIWEDDGEIVAVCNYEDRPGTAYVQLKRGYELLKPGILDHAEENLPATGEDGARRLRIVLNDFDNGFCELATARGYVKNELRPQWETRFDIPERLPPVTLKDGFRLASLADECDLAKVNRVIWRGFNHEGDPPAEGLEWRRQKLAAPNLRLDITVVTVAPDGDYASFCGMWYNAKHRYAMVEPVATDPAYRRMGLGTAAVLEGIRRCAELGARVVYVGSAQEFYTSIGFQKMFAAHYWEKQLIE